MSETPPRGSYRDSIYKDYALIFPDINQQLASYEVRVTKVPVRRKMLKDFDPNMYIPGYQGICLKAFSPTLLETQQEQDEAKAKGQDVMIYPLHGEGVPRVYVCNHKVNKYVGLKANTLKNQFDYPYFPCCFPKDQKDNPGRPRYQYENQNDEDNEEPSDEKRMHRPKIFSSNRFMKRNYYGQLPILIDKFLRVVDQRAFIMGDEYLPYVRQGTLKDINSVIDALIKAMMSYYADINIVSSTTSKDEIRQQEDDQLEYKRLITGKFPILEKIFDDNSYEFLETADKIIYLGQIRKQFITLLPANTTVQSTFNLELKTIRDQLINNTSYLDVKLFWRLLEEVFHVNIILFQRSEENPQGMFGSPLFLQEYLQYQRRKESSKWRFTVFLFETIGGKRDRLEYPQVELIQRFDPPPTPTIWSYFDDDKDRKLLKRLQSCFGKIYSYDGHSNLPIPNIFVSKPIAQCADFYGKIRLIQFTNGICIMTEPLPPMDRSDLDVNIDSKCALVPVQLDKALEFLNLEGVKDVRKVLIGGFVVGLQCKKDTDPSMSRIQRFVSFYIPVIPIKDTLQIESAPVSAPSFITQESLLDQFNRMARLARYLIEYILWTFSKWHKDNRGDVYDQTYVAKFTQEKFQISANHIYPPHILRRLDGNLKGVLNGGKILVPSTDVRNRLIFALQIKLIQNLKEVLSYYSRTYIQRYYQDVTDFDMQESNIILFGQEMVLSWINSKIPHYVLHDRIRFPECSNIELAVEEGEEKKETKQLCDLIIEKGLIVDPYFIKLENLDDHIYIVQQASNLSNALYICDTWYNMGYNVGPNDPGRLSTDLPFIFIAYNDAYDYTIKTINGSGSDKSDKSDKPVVLQYKYREQIFTMSLLRYTA